MTRGRFAAAVLILACLLLAADTLAWLRMERLLDRRLDRLAEDARQAGWQLDIASGQRGGWPFAATLALAAPRLHGGDALLPGGLTWTAERITAGFSPLHPRRITIAADGTQTILGANAGSLARSLRFWGAQTELHLPIAAAGGQEEADFEAAALHLAFPGASPDDVLTVAGLDGSLRWNPAAVALRLSLHGIGLPRTGLEQAISRPAGRQAGRDGGSRAETGIAASPHIMEAASLEVSLIGAPGFHQAGPAAWLRGWRDAGGRLLLREAGLDWGDCRLRASGQASLDENLQPDGAFGVDITGADALLDRLEYSRRITAPAAGAIRAILGLIGDARDGTGRTGALQLPLQLHGGVLLLGDIPLLRIPLPSAGQAPAGTLP